MAGLGRSIAEAVLGAGTRLVSRAAGAVLQDPRGQEAVARAVGLAQRGRRRLEEVQVRLMEAAGIPGRQDYDDLARQLARIKRKARELSAQMDAARGSGEAEGPPGERQGEGAAPTNGAAAGRNAPRSR
jgi:hypothetical protein